MTINLILFGISTSILGQQEAPMAPWEGVQKAFRNALPRPEGAMSPFETSFFFASTLLVVVIACYIVARSIQRRKEQPSARPPYQFFSRILKSLGVQAADRFLLRRVARQAKLAQPANLLFNRFLFMQHGRKWAQSITLPPLRGVFDRRLQRIADHVFEDSSASYG